MKLEIKEKKENPLLSRIEVSGIVTFEGATPSNEQMAKSIASQLKVDTSVVKMKNIYTGFGEQKAKFLAFVYKSKEELDRIDPKPKKQLEKEKKKLELSRSSKFTEQEVRRKSERAKLKETKPAAAPKKEATPVVKEEKKSEVKKEKPKEEPKPQEKLEPKPETKKEEVKEK